MPISRIRPWIAALSSLLLALPCLSAQSGGSTMGQARARRMASLGRLPTPAEIVVDHIVNYHRHGIPLPRAGEDVALDLRWDVPLPSHMGASVLQIGLATERLHDLEHARSMNIGLVIDCSGSMGDEDKLGRVKQAMRKFVEGLRPSDRIAIVTYSDEGHVLMPSRRIESGREVLDHVMSLRAGGGTNLNSGLQLGYKEVDRFYSPESTNRVLLLTDGIANSGVTNPAVIIENSRRYRGRVDLSTIGVGLDFNRHLLGELAQSGRGVFHFVANEEDIDQVFERELQSLIGGAVARKVRLEVVYDPSILIERVYGYKPELSRGRLQIELEDLNVGLTNVVLVKFRRIDGDRRGEDKGGSVRVQLSYEDRDGVRRELAGKTRFLDPEHASRMTDHEVRKNFTIAVMARAIHQMALDAQNKQFGAASRRIRLALDYVRLQYPSTKDADILRTKEMLTKYQKVLGARIERFRDL